jgi:NAD(P)-dependent dehydrogenase (short-subunit alcohol dehydrogenase family)
MEKPIAIVTGGLRGLGRAMAFGLARQGHNVVAVGHIETDIAETEAEVASTAPTGRILPLVADLRRPADCDRIVAAAVSHFGGVHILVNNAGLTFTTIDPARFRRPEPQKFWQVPDDIVHAVIETNYIAADQMARRVAPRMIEEGWGRIVNVTTKLDTMNRPHTSPYGASKAALEMATEVWAKEVEGTGLTINIVNPGAGANTPGMAEEMRQMSREGRASRLVEPKEMVAPLLYVVSREADTVNGWRFDANLWDPSLPPAEAARRSPRRLRNAPATGLRRLTMRFTRITVDPRQMGGRLASEGCASRSRPSSAWSLTEWLKLRFWPPIPILSAKTSPKRCITRPRRSVSGDSPLLCREISRGQRPFANPCRAIAASRTRYRPRA